MSRKNCRCRSRRGTPGSDVVGDEFDEGHLTLRPMMVEAEAFVPMMLPATNTLGLAGANGLGVRKDDRSETGQEFRWQRLEQPVDRRSHPL